MWTATNIKLFSELTSTFNPKERSDWGPKLILLQILPQKMTRKSAVKSPLNSAKKDFKKPNMMLEIDQVCICIYLAPNSAT